MRYTHMALLPLLAGMLAVLPADAQIFGTGTLPVIEVGPNLIQSTATAVRSLISNANEITMIQNEITSLANEAQMLASLPLSLVSEIDQAIQSYADLLNTGRGIAFTVEQSVQQFETLYATAAGGSATFPQRAQAMLTQLRQAGQMATRASAVYTRLCNQQARVGQLLAASAASPGEKAAQQAGNQLMGVLAEQQVSIQQLLATSSRLQLSQAMEDVVTNEQAYQNAQRFLGGATVVPIRGPGEGKGPTLPE